MCSRYEAPRADLLFQMFGVALEQTFATELWPGYTGPFVRPVSTPMKIVRISSIQIVRFMSGLFHRNSFRLV